MSKYEPLELHLRSKVRGHHEVTLRFREIEEVINDRLPESASVYRAWWSNQSNVKNRPQARSWISAGFLVAEVNLDKKNGWVRFEPKNSDMFR